MARKKRGAIKNAAAKVGPIHVQGYHAVKSNQTVGVPEFSAKRVSAARRRAALGKLRKLDEKPLWYSAESGARKIAAVMTPEGNTFHEHKKREDNRVRATKAAEKKREKTHMMGLIRRKGIPKKRGLPFPK